MTSITELTPRQNLITITPHSFHTDFRPQPHRSGAVVIQGNKSKLVLINSASGLRVACDGEETVIE